MEKENQLDGDLRRLSHERGKLPIGTEKVPYSRKEVANLPFYCVVDNMGIAKSPNEAMTLLTMRIAILNKQCTNVIPSAGRRNGYGIYLKIT